MTVSVLREQCGPLKVLAAGLTVAVLTLAGCGEGDAYKGAKGTVTGKVTYQGKSLPPGCTVTFIAAEGILAVGIIGADGQYKLVYKGDEKVPAVSYNVQIGAPPAAAEPMDMSKPSPPPAAPPFPAKYGATATSGLTFQAKEGANSFDIELKD